jgi:hypothetical protein
MPKGGTRENAGRKRKIEAGALRIFVLLPPTLVAKIKAAFPEKTIQDAIRALLEQSIPIQQPAEDQPSAPFKDSSKVTPLT